MCARSRAGSLRRQASRPTGAARATAGDAAGNRNFGPMPIGVGTGAAAIVNTARARASMTVIV